MQDISTLFLFSVAAAFLAACFLTIIGFSLKKKKGRSLRESRPQTAPDAAAEPPLRGLPLRRKPMRNLTPATGRSSAFWINARSRRNTPR
jgi:hypothetical protein